MRRWRLCHNSCTTLLLTTLLSWPILVALRCAALSPDGLSLLAFKAAVSDDPSSSLADWNEDDTDPCHWPGISCANVSGSTYPRVVGIAVSGKNLSGYIPSELGTLLFLRRLNLHGNRLSGPVPTQLFNASSLHSLFLYDNLLSGPFPAAACDLPRLQNLDLSKNAFSGSILPDLRGCRQLQRLLLSNNRFSGVIPAGIWPEMVDLVQLDLSSNQFNGSIPPDLGSLDSLSGTLNLSHNQFSGKIPESLGNLPATVSLDLRFNNLSGEIPSTGSLANQGPTAFLNNPGLCGFPLQIPCEEPAQVGPPPGGRPGSPAAKDSDQAEPEQGKKGKLRSSLIVLIAVSDAAGVALVGLILVYAYWRVKDQEKCCGKLGGGEGGGRRRCWRRWCIAESGGESASSDEDGSGSGGEGGGVEGELVTMDKGFKVELEELLRASAYVLGKGGNGIVYKVVVGDGVAVAVRRLGDGGAGFAAGIGGGGGGGGGGATQQKHYYKEFAAEVAAMGRLRHPNVVRLRAYYWAADEKLLISDFISNGNLATALRGRSGQASLPWSLRLRIAKGAARGLAYIHDCSPRKLVHAAVKPSNILLDADYNSFLADFGLPRLLSLTTTSTTSSSFTSVSVATLPSARPTTCFDRPNPYRAPEARLPATKPTQKSDVYSFGVVLLEMLTGRSPEMSSPSPSSSSSAAAVEQVPELVRWVRKGFNEARPLSEMVDPVLLREAHAKKEAAAAFQVALACTEVDPDARPRMKIVSENLDRIQS